MFQKFYKEHSNWSITELPKTSVHVFAQSPHETLMSKRSGYFEFYERKVTRSPTYRKPYSIAVYK